VLASSNPSSVRFDYYDEVIASIRDAESILIFGPGHVSREMSMTDSSSRPEQDQEPGFFRTFGRDLRRVLADTRRVGLKRSMSRTLTELQEFYFTTERRDRLAGMGKVKRWLFLSFWLFKSLFLRLTPARRILLLLALLLLSVGSTSFTVGYDIQISLRLPSVGVALLLVILMLELKDKLLSHEEMQAGRVVQRALMPERSPEVPGWEACLYTQSANEVGGDLVDYLALDASRFGIALGDVAGKGLPAALLMAKLQATLRALAPEVDSLAELGSWLNRILHRDGLPNRFATLVYLAIVADSGRVRMLNAGHMQPLILRSSSVEEMPQASSALGMFPDAIFVEQQVDVGIGDLLVAYSDGLTEATNRAGEFFGEERLHGLVADLAGLTAKTASARLVAAVEDFVGDAPRHDDLSLIVLKRTS
jgi:serine phosphatase RsbU (regulator of sigma subunit)